MKTTTLTGSNQFRSQERTSKLPGIKILLRSAITLCIMLRMFVLLLVISFAKADDTCSVIHGRAHLYGGDGQLRIWHIGTHHDFEPDETSWSRVVGWLEAGVKQFGNPYFASPASTVNLFGDFLVCPTEPLRTGAVQKARIIRVQHRYYTPAK